MDSSSRRTFSSSSSSFSSSSCSSKSIWFSDESPVNSPASPFRLLGVPFSWEQLPGKSKDFSNHHKINESTDLLLPLPPHRNNYLPTTGKNHRRKTKSFSVIVGDPFAAALFECSKDEENSDEDDRNFRRLRRSQGESSKTLSKNSFGDKLGLMNLYGSCRRSCAVSESIVYLPSSRKDHLLLPPHHR